MYYPEEFIRKALEWMECGYIVHYMFDNNLFRFTTYVDSYHQYGTLYTLDEVYLYWLIWTENNNSTFSPNQ